MTVTDWAVAALAIGRTFGVRGAGHRIRFEVRKRLSQLKDGPSPVSDRVRRATLPVAYPFRPDVARVRAVAHRRAAMARAERVLAGEYQRYRWTWVKRPTAPPEWIRHPHSGHIYSADMPWYRASHLDPRAGDIKDVWDPARFGWAVDLARGWILTGDEQFAAAFAESVDAFLDACPPFHGVQWSCGQETAIRAIAWLWCEAAFDDATSFRDASRQRLREALAWSAERIEDAIDYAISQRNNHGLSEATGLISLGVRLTGADPRAARWLSRGARCLTRLIRDQFERDGWYIQHSFAYTRLALDQMVVARRALRSVGRDLPADCVDRIGSAIQLLGRCADPHTGEVPNHGANDGSFVLPLTTRSYVDFRPSLTAAAATFRVPLPSSMPADAEVLAWLSEDAPSEQPVRSPPRVSHGPSGWALAETSGAKVFARAGRYRSRPGHIDPCHIDVWIQGAKHAVDAGTFRYLAPPPWRNGLTGLDVHNTVSIEGLPAARPGPRFLWLRWPNARLLSAQVTDADEARIVMENHSWRHAGVIHRRTCRVRSAGVLVIDELQTPATFDHTVRVQWLLDDRAAVEMWTAGDATLIQQSGAEGSTAGWISEGYAERRPGRSIRLEVRPRDGHLRIISAFGDAALVADSSIRDERMITCAS